VSFAETEEPIRSREIFGATNLKTLWAKPSRDIQKREKRENQKCPDSGYRDKANGIKGIQHKRMV